MSDNYRISASVYVTILLSSCFVLIPILYNDEKCKSDCMRKYLIIVVPICYFLVEFLQVIMF